jgi:hypothetical protein
MQCAVIAAWSSPAWLLPIHPTAACVAPPPVEGRKKRPPRAKKAAKAVGSLSSRSTSSCGGHTPQRRSSADDSCRESNRLYCMAASGADSSVGPPSASFPPPGRCNTCPAVHSFTGTPSACVGLDTGRHCESRTRQWVAMEGDRGAALQFDESRWLL